MYTIGAINYGPSIGAGLNSAGGNTLAKQTGLTRVVLRGAIINTREDLRYTQKPICFPIFTNNIWSY